MVVKCLSILVKRERSENLDIYAVISANTPVEKKEREIKRLLQPLCGN